MGESHRSSLSSSSNQFVKKLSSAEIKINEDMENDSIELQMTVMTPNTTDQRQKSRRGSRRASQTNKTTKQIQSRKQMSQIVEASGGSNQPLSLPSQINGGEAGREDVEKTLESHRSSLSSSSNQSVKKLSSAEIKINEDMENDSIELQMTETPDTTTTTNQRKKSRRASRRASQTNKTTKQIQSRKRMSQKPKSLYSENS